MDADRLWDAYTAARADLLAERTDAGHWVGELSSSALSTATAVSALAIVRQQAGLEESTRLPPAEDERFDRLIARGLRYLADGQNADGGWGDTDQSHSNIATTMLVQAAFRLTGLPASHDDLWQQSQAYVQRQGGIAGLRRRYGRDKTFAVPILTNCALARLVPWSAVSPLPFELACLPQSWFRFLQLPVVSYAIPALVAIGQARHFHRPSWNPLVRGVRAASVERSLRVLSAMQPASGGFLEATPLTSFVVMSLASAGQVAHPVTQRGVQFLLASVREDGSWPIDTNLATWNTTLAVNALAGNDEGRSTNDEGMSNAECRMANGVAEAVSNIRHSALGIRHSLLPWLLTCQHREPHPYTGAAPGGWGWSDLSGAVPDVDDTSGALLVLAHLLPDATPEEQVQIEEAAQAGLVWLLSVQNSDGGWPTFCRGWGKLPFDRSGSDLTAHALRAIAAWGDQFVASNRQSKIENQKSPPLHPARLEAAIAAGFGYLERTQLADGSWIPLWFGNQDHPREENPVYGTAKVLLAYRDLGRLGETAAQRALDWLTARQNPDGGWGAAADPAAADLPAPRSSVEETALAVGALLAQPEHPKRRSALDLGLDWLAEKVESKCYRACSPIGFYFAKLWYYERLYPLTFTVSALGQAVKRLPPRSKTAPQAVRAELGSGASN